MTTALIVVDVQNDFAHPKGNLSVPDGEVVVYRVNRLTDDYEHVIYTKDYHPPVTDHFDKYGGHWPVHCIGGTWGSDFHDDLYVDPDAPRVLKGMHAGEDGYSGFYVDDGDEIEPTPLNELLQDRKVTHVDVVGIALDVCVKATALDALDLRYYTRVIREATAPVTAEGGEAAVEEMRAKGVTVV